MKMRDGRDVGRLCRPVGGVCRRLYSRRGLFVMRINLRDMMDCNDAMMGEAADPFTLATQLVHKTFEQTYALTLGSLFVSTTTR